MFAAPQLFTPSVKPVVSGYTAYAVRFDGTNDYMSRGAGLTGAADGQKGILSFWVNFTGGDGNFQIIFEDDGQRGLYRSNGNKISMSWKDAAGNGMFGVDSTTDFTSSSGWMHVLASWDGTQNVSNSYNGLWVNDVNEGTPNRNGSITIDYTRTDWAFGHRLTGSLKCDMEIADFYFNSVESFDFSVTANRRKFITAGLRPVDLGSDGSTPTGTAPIIFFKASSGNPAAFATNSGSGGGFNLTGTLTAAGSNP